MNCTKPTKNYVENIKNQTLYNKEYYTLNKQKILEQRKVSYNDQKKEIGSKRKSYYIKNRPKLLEKFSDYYSKKKY